MDAFPDPQAFGHLLHDVAGRVSALGLLMDTFEPDERRLADEDREVLDGLRRSTNDLRRLITDLGEVTRAVGRHTAAVPREERAGALLRRALDNAIEDSVDLSVSLEHGDLEVCADGWMVSLLLRTLLRQLGSGATAVTLTARGEDGGVRFTLGVERPINGSHTLDHFYSRLAAACGGSFAWVAAGRGRAAVLTLPTAAAVRARAVA